MNKLRLIGVPVNSKDYYISESGALRYMEYTSPGIVSKAMDAGFKLSNNLHEIVGYTELNDKKYIVIKNK